MSQTCFVCGAPTETPAVAVAGLKGEARALTARFCAEACREDGRRFAARRGVQRAPARAGSMVALLGILTGLFFILSARDLGRPLLVFGVLAAGTTRLAYPDALPTRLVAAIGLRRARELGQWLGVLLGVAAVILGLAFLVF